MYTIFSIRPTGATKEEDPFNTNTDYCHYDEAHDDYLFQESWRDLIINGIQNRVLSKDQWQNNFKRNSKLDISELQ